MPSRQLLASQGYRPVDTLPFRKQFPAEVDAASTFHKNVERLAIVGLNFDAILKEASSVGVQHYFVEQDQTPGDPIESLRQSYAFLSQ